MKINSPLEHFEFNIYAFFYNVFYDFSINSGILYLISLIIFIYFFYFIIKKSTIISFNSNFIIEYMYNLVLSIFKQQIISARILRFFPFIFILFIFIFILNFSSLFIFGVSLTGHISITAYLSFSIFIGLIIIGFLNLGSDFFKFFVPTGVPKLILDFIILIEIFSFAIRPFSLSIRLFANMSAGHTLMGIFSKFCAFIIKNFFILFIIPIILVFLVFTLEIAVSLIQAYIFVSLVCIYLNDVCNLH